jgi:hypothetical protein
MASKVRRPVPASSNSERVSLKDEARNSLDEARMVLPGSQAVFGFQLIAVFNDRFAAMDFPLRILHYVSITLVVMAIALIMTPAAYDRIAEPRIVTAHFLDMTAVLLTVAMGVFGAALSLELLVVTTLILGSFNAGVVSAGCALAVFATLWFYLPWRRRRNH